MKGWVLLNSTALEHRRLLVQQQFSRHGTMELSYKPHTYNFLFITSFEERTEGLKHAVDNKVHLNIVLQENACHGILSCFKEQYKCSQKSVAA
jgi:hypothetical protein